MSSNSVIMQALVLVLALLLPSTSAQTCAEPVVFIDIHDRPVSDPSTVVQYGLWIGMGSTSQNGSLWPAITQNETIFQATDFCGPESPANCRENSRGFVDISDSNSWQNNSLNTLKDDTPLLKGTNHTFGNDTLKILTQITDPGPPFDTTLEKFPLVVMSNYSSKTNPICGPAGVLGLGRDSQALTHLKEENLISTRSFGLYMGPKLQHADQPERGSLVMGGYDAGRFKLPLVTFDQTSASEKNAYSPFKLTITSLSLASSGGQPLELLSNGSIPAYISTTQKPVRFSRSVTQLLKSALNAQPTANSENTLQLTSPYDGALSITVEDANGNPLTLRYDSRWLSGENLQTPISAENLAGLLNATDSASDGDSDSTLLGAAFLTRAYLFVNYDAQPPTFSLAEAVPGDQDILQRPLCLGEAPIPAQPSSSRTSEEKIPRRVLVGVVVASIVGITVMFLLICLIAHKRRQRSINGSLDRDTEKVRDDDAFEPVDTMGFTFFDTDGEVSNPKANAASSYTALEKLDNLRFTKISLLPFSADESSDAKSCKGYQPLTNKVRRHDTSQKSKISARAIMPADQLALAARIAQSPQTIVSDSTQKTYVPDSTDDSSTQISSRARSVTYRIARPNRRSRLSHVSTPNTMSRYMSILAGYLEGGDADKSLPTTPLTPHRRSTGSDSGSLVFFSLEQPPPIPDFSVSPTDLIANPIPIHPHLTRAAFLRSSYHPSVLSIPSPHSVTTLPSAFPVGYTPSATPASPSASFYSFWRSTSRSRSRARPKSTLTMLSQSTDSSLRRSNTSGPYTAVATAARLSRLAALQAQVHSGLREIVVKKGRRIRSKSRGRSRNSDRDETSGWEQAKIVPQRSLDKECLAEDQGIRISLDDIETTKLFRGTGYQHVSNNEASKSDSLTPERGRSITRPDPKESDRRSSTERQSLMRISSFTSSSSGSSDTESPPGYIPSLLQQRMPTPAIKEGASQRNHILAGGVPPLPPMPSNLAQSLDEAFSRIPYGSTSLSAR